MDELYIEHGYGSICLCPEKDKLYIEMYEDSKDCLIGDEYDIEEIREMRDFLNKVLEGNK